MDPFSIIGPLLHHWTHSSLILPFDLNHQDVKIKYPFPKGFREASDPKPMIRLGAAAFPVVLVYSQERYAVQDPGRSQIFERARRLILGATAALIFVTAGCRSQLEVSVSDNRNKNTGATSPESPTPQPEPASVETKPPVEKTVDGGIKTLRTHYQTRNVIALSLTDELAGEDGAFTLSDQKTAAVIAIDLWSEPAFESTDGYSYGTTGGKVLLLYPLVPEMQTKLAYGENNWKFSLQDQSAPLSSTVTFTRKDFDVLGQQATSSRVGSQAPDGFQGGISFRGGNSLAPDRGQLTSGLLNLVNR